MIDLQRLITATDGAGEAGSGAWSHPASMSVMSAPGHVSNSTPPQAPPGTRNPPSIPLPQPPPIGRTGH